MEEAVDKACTKVSIFGVSLKALSLVFKNGIFFRCPQIVFQILGTWCDNDSAFHEKLCKCNRLILYLASHYHDLFLAFFEKHYTSLSFLHFGDKLRR